MLIIKFFKAIITYYQAKRQADKQLKLYGTRQYVIGVSGNKLVVGDKKGIRDLQYRSGRKKKGEKQISVPVLQSSCFYHTSYADGKGAMVGIQKKARRRICIQYLMGKAQQN